MRSCRLLKRCAYSPWRYWIPSESLGCVGVEDKMDVIAHQAEGVAVPPVALDRLAEEAEIGDAVVIVTKDRGAVDAARGHVEVAVGKPGSKDAGHRLRA